MNLRLTNSESGALRAKAEQEGRSMQEVAKTAIAQYVSERPQRLLGDDAYPTFTDKAAALLHSPVRNHALVDDNERLAWSATRIFCLLNDQDLTYTVDEAEDMMLGAAAGQRAVPGVADWSAARLEPAS